VLNYRLMNPQHSQREPGSPPTEASDKWADKSDRPGLSFYS
jgi:hypothetical protein